MRNWPNEQLRESGKYLLSAGVRENVSSQSGYVWATSWHKYSSDRVNTFKIKGTPLRSGRVTHKNEILQSFSQINS